MSERKRKRIPEKIRQRIYDMYGGRCANQILIFKNHENKILFFS